MSTTAGIGLTMPDGTIKAVYLHWGDGAGETLAKHYTEHRKVERLVNLGFLSSIGAEIEPDKPTLLGESAEKRDGGLPSRPRSATYPGKAIQRPRGIRGQRRWLPHSLLPVPLRKRTLARMPPIRGSVEMERAQRCGKRKPRLKPGDRP